MTDFFKSLEIGIASGEKVEFENKEIKSVLNDLKKQILEGTNNRIVIRIQKRNKFGLFDLNFPLTNNDDNTVEEIVADNNGYIERLAVWQYGPGGGYPCTIRYKDNTLTCFDKESLENCLKSFLEEPEIGQKINSLLKRGKESS